MSDDKIVNLPDALNRSRDTLQYRIGRDIGRTIVLYSILALSILGAWKALELVGWL